MKENMDNFISEKFNTKIDGQFDVVVAGGGIAGVSAALAAARNGAKVLLIENQYLLGGLATAGMIAIYLPLCDGMGHQVSFGIAEELFWLSMKHGNEGRFPKPWVNNESIDEKAKIRMQVKYNPYLFAIEMEKLLYNESVDILFGTRICGVTMKEKKVECVIVENKNGRFAYKVKSVVDATGDADIFSFCGEKLDTFKQGNLLAAWYYGSSNKSSSELKQIGCADIPDDEKQKEVAKLSNIRFEGIDAWERSRMIYMSHESILNDFLKQRECDSSYRIDTIATIPEIRMTRKIKGSIELSTHDECKYFEDSIGVIGNWKKKGPYYEIPYRCLYNENVKNVLAAGRCISTTESMWDVTRVIPACAVTGEAAGVAASIAASADESVSELNVTMLQNCLQGEHHVHFS